MLQQRSDFVRAATGYSIGPSLTELHLPTRGSTVLHFAPVILPIALLFATLACAGIAALWRRSRHVFWIVVLWFLFPLGFAIAGTILTRHPFNVRYIVLGLPSFVLIVSMGLLALNTIAWRCAALGALAVVSAYSLKNYFFDARYFREDNRAAGAFLAANAAPGDIGAKSAPRSRSRGTPSTQPHSDAAPSTATMP